MRSLLLMICFFSYGSHVAQSTSEEKIKETITVFFEGFHQGDTLKMKSVLGEKVLLQSAYINKEGESVLRTEPISALLEAIANRKPNEKWDERLLDYKIQVDANMANAWVRYEFWLNNEFSHCGVNSFQLFKSNATWKIIYLIDTRRRKGCGK